MAIKAEIGARESYESLAERVEIGELKEKIRWLAGDFNPSPANSRAFKTSWI